MEKKGWLATNEEAGRLLAQKGCPWQLGRKAFWAQPWGEQPRVRDAEARPEESQQSL